jgi:hypothetical protein
MMIAALSLIFVVGCRQSELPTVAREQGNVLDYDMLHKDVLFDSELSTK